MTLLNSCSLLLLLVYLPALLCQGGNTFSSIDETQQFVGINGYMVVWRGYVFGASGFGEEARAFLKGMHKLGINVKIDPLDEPNERHCSIATEEENKFYKSLIVDTSKLVPHKKNPDNPFIIAIHHHMIQFLEPSSWADYSIGRAMWEMAKIPVSWIPPTHAMNEIWVPSAFNKENFHEAGVPMEKLYIVGESVDEHYVKEAEKDEIYEEENGSNSKKKSTFAVRGLKKVNFLSLFNWNYRKGWDILVEAFAREFPPTPKNADIQLVLKVFSTWGKSIDYFQGETERVLRAKGVISKDMSMPSNIVFFNEGVTSKDMPQFYRNFDAFVLPTRAEGWGRGTMEAMASGVPVITTKYSGQSEFVNSKNAFIIPYKIVPVTEEAVKEYMYFEGGSWAESNIDELRKLMRKVVEKPKKARKKGVAGRKWIIENFSLESIANQMKTRFEEIIATKLK
eukprot:TRINITY_DN8118_c0_g1_i1.p1 TRINITY_DN8118_c0_g1~~TRINITY_DN8118_c0_g1_i1.p1  ORF type:complete len:452 (+),score=98.17 TRINITY_DN8118_c0_g1_i1:62-1417(+)